MQDRRRFLKNTAAAATATTLPRPRRLRLFAGAGTTRAEQPQKTRHLEQ